MPSIAESRSIGVERLKSGDWAYVPQTLAAPPAVSAPTNAYPAAPNQYLRAPLPDDFWQQPDAQRQFHAAAIPQTRISPLPANTDPVAGAQAASQAIQVIQSGVATPPSASSGIDVDMLSAVNRQSFGSLQSFSNNTASEGGASPTLTTLSITTATQGSNDMIVTMSSGHDNTGGLIGASPGAGWTALSGGTVAFWKVFPTPGSQTITQTIGASYDIAMTAATFKTNGSTPVFTAHGTGSGGRIITSLTFTPTAGNSLLFISSGGGIPDNISAIVDTANNKWSFLGMPSIQSNNPPPNPNLHQAAVSMAFVQSASGVSTTITVTMASNGGSWAFYEISNVGSITSGSYTFQSSDNTEMVVFVGEANVRATLPNPALAVGWQTLAVNYNTAGILTLTSPTTINGSGANVPIEPGAAAWIFSDGTGYWISHLQPSFSCITGSILPSQMNFGINASATTFWRGDGAWATIDWNSLPGLAGNLAVKYNGLTLASGGIPSIVAAINRPTNTADIAATTVLSPTLADKRYRLSYEVTVTTAATTSSTLPDIQFTWADSDSVAILTAGPFGSATPSANTNTTYYQGSIFFSAASNAFADIRYQTGITTHYASVGGTSMKYRVNIILEVL